MRGRKKEPEGKRVTVSVKVSESVAAAIDAARGEASRSTWLQQAIAGQLAPPRIATEPEQPRKPRAKGPCEHRVQPGSYCRSCDRLI